MIVLVVMLCLSIPSLISAVFSFLQRGPVFSTLFLVSNKHEREKMKTKKNYFFCGFIFAFIGLGFLLLGISAYLRISILTYIAAVLFCGVAISAIVFSIHSASA